MWPSQTQLRNVPFDITAAHLSLVDSQAMRLLAAWGMDRHEPCALFGQNHISEGSVPG